jgi:YbbR domain-containing protein
MRDDLQFKGPQPPGLFERWLRTIFVKDLNIKLLALGITLVLWFAVTGQKAPVTKRIPGVQLSFVHPNDMAISNDPPTKVDVTVTGSNDKLKLINPMDLLATVSVDDHATGDRVIRLSRDRVKIELLPAGVQIEGFQPAVVSLRLEPVAETSINVDLKLEGKVPEGYEVYAASANPAKVRVRGPASTVNALKQAPTESILLDGKKSSFDLAQVAVDIPNQKIDVLDGVVQVHVEIGERSVEKSFGNVSVQGVNGAHRSEIATLTVSGPASVLSQLRSEEIRLVVDTPAGAENRFTLELPASAQGKVKLVSVKPARFLARDQ